MNESTLVQGSTANESHARERRRLLRLAAGAAIGVSISPLFGRERHPPTLDLHAHLFGIGDAGTGCRIAKKITEGLQFRLMTASLGLKNRAATVDEAYVKVLVEQAMASGLDRVAILGQDAAYDANGRPDWNLTSFFVPNSYVFEIAKRHEQLLIPCPSINPARADAVDELNRVHGLGARVFKIHPPTQGVNVADPRFRPFYRRCAELKIVVMVHTGHEHSAPVIDKDLANPSRLQLMLDEGCTTVACHCGTGWPTDAPDQLPAFLKLLRRYPNLWGDTAVLGTPGRVRDFARLVEDDVARSRLLHGSDFPFPVAPVAFDKQIGIQKANAISRQFNFFKRDFDLKESLGIGVASARRAFELLFGIFRRN